MMCDVLPLLSRLSRVFQSSILDLSTVDNLISSTNENLQLLSGQTGYFARKQDSDLSSSLAPFDIRHSPEMKHRFQQHILQKFLYSVVQNIKDRFPDTRIYANFKVLTPINLPQTAEEAGEIRYGEKEVQNLGQQYGIGDQPFIHSEELMLEWSDLRIYMILNCASKTTIEMLEMLSDHGSALSTVYPNFNKLAQVCLLLPLTVNVLSLQCVEWRLAYEVKWTILHWITVWEYRWKALLWKLLILIRHWTLGQSLEIEE